MSETHTPLTLLTVAIQAGIKSDHERMVSALATFAIEDPSFQVSIDRDSGQIVLGGMNELQLDEKIDLLRRQYKIAVEIGAPQVSYREAITRRIEKDYTYKKQIAGTGQFARVKIIVEPYTHGTIFEPKIVGDAVPEAFIPGVATVMASGVLAGFPLIDVKVALVDVAYHDVDSSALSFELAARAAFREALRDGGSKLMEPIMAVEITGPAEYTGSVTGDLLGRRGQFKTKPCAAMTS